MEAVQEFGQTDTSVASIMKFISFAATLERQEMNYDMPYLEQGRYSIALSVLDWNQSSSIIIPEK